MRCIEMNQYGFQYLKDFRLIETWDVLKSFSGNVAVPTGEINRNMRCIEMHDCCYCNADYDWLIETWDVLKLNILDYIPTGHKINRNMRCIEMTYTEVWSAAWIEINRNMRCIEIWLWNKQFLHRFRLIETWDVLKF